MDEQYYPQYDQDDEEYWETYQNPLLEQQDLEQANQQFNEFFEVLK